MDEEIDKGWIEWKQQVEITFCFLEFFCNVGNLC